MAGAASKREHVIDVPVPSPKRVVSVKLEVELIEEMDRLWRLLGYNSRSDFIREAILYYMQIAARRLETSNTAFKTALGDAEEQEEEIGEIP